MTARFSAPLRGGAPAPAFSPALSLASSIFLSLALSLGAAAAGAQEQEELTWYVVEVIVFERTSEIGRNAETWPEDPGLPALADALELTPEGVPLEALERGPGGEAPEAAGEDAATPSAAVAAADPGPDANLPRAFRLLPPEEFRLADAWKSLEKSSAYRPLVQLAWIQPGLPAEKARLVHVRNANGALGTVSLTPEADGITLAPANRPMLASGVRMARDPSQVALDGTLRVHRARYLHVQADLLYYRPMDSDTRAPVPPEGDPNALPAKDSPDTAYIEQLLAEGDTAPRVFRLTESRRMRSRELHYLDHPLFGVLVEAWPLELPDPPAAAVEAPPEGGSPETPAETTQPASGG